MYFKLCVWLFLVIIYCGRLECKNNDSDIEQNGVEPKIANTLFQIWKRTKNPLMKLLGQSFLTLESKFDKVEKLIQDANIEKQLTETSRIEDSLTRTINGTEQRLDRKLTDKFDTLTNELCRMYTCSEWSEWTTCDAKQSGEYGLKNRTRMCGKQAVICSERTEYNNETDTEICQTVCPPEYNLTLSEFCIKLYKNLRVSREDAEKHCQSDGGHLINIDSNSKTVDVTDLLEQERPDRVWVGGIQRSRGGKWEFSYGSSRNSEYTNWHYDQPNGGTFPNCMYLLPSDWDWADYPCSSIYSFMCEIVSN